MALRLRRRFLARFLLFVVFLLFFLAALKIEYGQTLMPFNRSIGDRNPLMFFVLCL